MLKTKNINQKYEKKKTQILKYFKVWINICNILQIQKKKWNNKNKKTFLILYTCNKVIIYKFRIRLIWIWSVIIKA